MKVLPVRPGGQQVMSPHNRPGVANIKQEVGVEQAMERSPNEGWIDSTTRTTPAVTFPHQPDNVYLQNVQNGG